MYPSLSYGERTVAWLFRVESTGGYVALGWVTVAVCVVFISLMVRRAFDGDIARWAAMVILAGPIMWVVFGRVVHGDVFVIVAGIMLGLFGRKVPAAAAAALLALAGNPEQAVVMSVCLGVVSLAQPFKAWRRGVTAAIVVSVAGWLLLNAWSRSAGVPTRLDVLGEKVRLSLELFFMQLPLQIYAGFGLSALVIIWAVADQRRVDAVLLVVGVLGIPLAMTAITTDQSRVLVSTSTAALAAVLVAYGPSLFDLLNAKVHYPLALTASVLLFLPAIELTGNFIRVPWVNLFPFVQYYLVDWLPVG